MSLSLTSRRTRWAVPGVAAALVAGAVALPSLASAGSGHLAARTPAQLLADLTASTATALSGTVVQTSRLGLPELPTMGGGETGPMALASGSHTLRVWADGPERARVALLGQLAEYDVVHAGRNVWTYSSQQDEAVHYVLPEHQEAAPAPVPSILPSTPAEAVDHVLAELDPTTVVGVEPVVTVAGRSARQLVLTPRDTSSLVGSVRVAVDGATSAPLRVQVFSAAEPVVPAFEVGFTDVSFSRPAASVFAFSAPPGAKTRTVQVAAPEHETGTAAPEAPATEVLGKGWTSVLLVRGVDVAGLTKAQPQLLDSLTTRVPEGRLLRTALLSVLLTDDGRVLVGAVKPEVLRAYAA